LNVRIKIIKYLQILCLPILLLSTSLAWGFNSLWLYEYGFNKYNVSQTTGLSEDELERSATGLIDYFNSSDEYVHIVLTQEDKQFELFTQDEQIHFKDVKQLVWLDYKILLITASILIMCFLWLFFWRKGTLRYELIKALAWGSGLSLFIIAILALLSLFNFENLFLQFHFLVFTNQYWSAEGYMLLLFPGGFWFDAAIFCLSFVTIMAIMILSISIVCLRIIKHTVMKR
jgi:integral membrane protein (TIGR01906 family)